ncbi:hypothetical protein [Hymenobacter coccineus]|uniref:Uncharacterized protein n=1 Tax=Hymenobacter coccineus TaxID=1908235 RepID=A0A1G1TJR5_9BACT|nr:hypothetical protein [Hymenobacter coccineus]OGX91121.1 hypothetical protein BEN49_21055 [Hymenobacter coccineus]
MPTIEENNLAFDFPPDWYALKYDHDAEPASGEPAGFYRRIILSDGVQQVRGMDILCRLPGETKRLQLIEVKDERKRDPTADVALRHEELRQTMLRKTLGTLASLVLAERLGDASLRPMACLSQQPLVEVVLFLEEPPLAPARTTQLRKVTEKDRKIILDQKLTAKLYQWGIPFFLYDLDKRKPALWQVRDLA